MLKNALILVLFATLGYLMFLSADFKVIAAGIAVFLVGMFFMEEGFKMLSGGILENLIEKTTNTLAKALFSGFFVTSLVQSSSLVTVIVISFLSADLIGLLQAVAVVFGSNIGSTTTAWIVAGFGMKVKIAYYAMPMLVFGTVLQFMDNRSMQGAGKALVGLGFIFMGIGYMKEGFDALEQGIDLAQFAMSGILGVLVYIAVGMVATVIIQSSAATMAIVITALASGQIVYVNALALAIGANIGTTITAIMGAMASNENGKRLAAAHVIFNIVTAGFAVIFIQQFADAVDLIAGWVGIGAENYVIKLALFHTVFNLVGVAVVTPFIGILVDFLKTKFVPVMYAGRPKYLDEAVIEMPQPALAALKKETERLYDKAMKALTHALLLHRHDVWSERALEEVIASSHQRIPIDVSAYYRENIKGLYGEIIRYATMAQVNMEGEDHRRSYEYKLASRDIVEALKDVQELNKNITRYVRSPNANIRNEYNMIRTKIATLLRGIEKVRQKPNDILVVTQIELIREDAKEMDLLSSERIDELVRQKKIDTEMATSLMNDSAFAYQIVIKLLEMATILWIKDAEMRAIELSDEEKAQ